MTKKEIIKRSQSERYNYPDVFQDDVGIGIKTEDEFTTIRSWDYSERQSRKVTLKVSSYKGISYGAVHVYGTLRVEGVVLEKAGAMHRRMPNLEHTRQNPLVSYSYTLQLQRPVTPEDNFENYEVGDLTNRWNNIEDLISFTKIVFKKRFKGNWELYLDCDWNNKTEKIDEKA